MYLCDASKINACALERVAQTPYCKRVDTVAPGANGWAASLDAVVALQDVCASFLEGGCEVVAVLSAQSAPAECSRQGCVLPQVAPVDQYNRFADSAEIPRRAISDAFVLVHSDTRYTLTPLPLVDTDIRITGQLGVLEVSSLAQALQETITDTSVGRVFSLQVAREYAAQIRTQQMNGGEKGNLQIWSSDAAVRLPVNYYIDGSSELFCFAFSRLGCMIMIS